MSDLIPPGTYKARASSSTFGTTKNGGEVIEVNFVITQPGECEGMIARWSGYFTDKVEERTKESLGYMGFSPASQADWVQLCETYQDASAIFPSEVRVVIEHKPGSDGVVRAEVRWVNSLFGKGIKPNQNPLDQQTARSFAARMMAGSKPAPAPTPRTPGSGPGGSTVGQRTSSQAARDASGGQRPANSGAQPPPDDFGPVEYDADMPF